MTIAITIPMTIPEATPDQDTAEMAVVPDTETTTGAELTADIPATASEARTTAINKPLKTG